MTTEELGFVGSSSLVASGLQQEASEQMLGFVDTAVKLLEHDQLDDCFICHCLPLHLRSIN